MKKYNILCFGDSLSWGWIPTKQGIPTSRYEPDQRWTSILSKTLGDEFHIIEEGLNNRTTNIVDTAEPRTNASTYLPACLASHMPLDLVIIMLGTNDTKVTYRRTSFEIASGMAQLIGQVRSSAGGIGTIYPSPNVMIISPPFLGEFHFPYLQTLFTGAHQKVQELETHYRNLARLTKVSFMSAASSIDNVGIDGIHLSEENNIQLGKAIAEEVKRIL